MKVLDHLINLFNALQCIRKLVKSFEKKWYVMTYAYHQVGITYYDLNTEKRILDEIFYNPNYKMLGVTLYTSKNILTINLEDAKNYILFDICEKDFVLLNGKDLNSSVYIKRDANTLLALVNNIATDIIVLDDIFIENKLHYILEFNDLNKYYQDIKPTYANYYNEFINNVTDKYILSKAIIVTETDFDDDSDEEIKRYVPLFGYFISFNIYDDICKTYEHLSEPFTNDLTCFLQEVSILYRAEMNCT